MIKQIARYIYFIENSFLTLLFISLLVLACAQIVLRNFFDASIPGGNEVLRILLLWLALLGATFASRENKHIKIDLINKILPKSIHGWVQRIIFLITSGICILVAYHGYRLVYIEYEFAGKSVYDLPLWVVQLVIPLSFFIIALRYLIRAFIPHPLNQESD